jgi:hypothetical protein
VLLEYSIWKVQENQQGLEFIGAYQPLICADDSNLLYKTIYHREEHRWCIVAVGVEVQREKNCML